MCVGVPLVSRGCLPGFPTCLFLQRGKSWPKSRKMPKSLRVGRGHSFARREGGLKAVHLPLLLQRGWKTLGEARRGQSGLSTGSLNGQGVLKGDSGQGWVCQSKEATACCPWLLTRGQASNWNLGYWPYPFFTSTSTNSNAQVIFFFKGFYSKSG